MVYVPVRLVSLWTGPADLGIRFTTGSRGFKFFSGLTGSGAMASLVVLAGLGWDSGSWVER
jgi:hypothetical protein